MNVFSHARLKLFVSAWMLYTVHFATNIVREHYPAFALIDHGNFRVDEYQGFHSDIFVHRDGHSYINNNVATSAVAAVPLLVFDPALDALEAYSRRKIAEAGRPPEAIYRFEDRPVSKQFYETATARGLTLRFGGAAFVTSAFLMAPLSALCVVLMYDTLRRRGLDERRALALAALFGFGTPVFFRTAHLCHNMFVMYAVFGAVLLLQPTQAGDHRARLRRLAAGFLCGAALAFDYSGVIAAPAFYLYLLGTLAARRGSLRAVVGESLVFIAGTVPPVLFLLWSQWAMFGNPFLPSQFWMPAVNYTDRGWRGFGWPSPSVIGHNLFDLRYGLVPFAPLLLLALVPPPRRGGSLVTRGERGLIVGFTVLLILFCGANAYSLVQWNTGFRYLAPLVPLLFLPACDHLARLRPAWLAALAVPVVAHSWVLAAIRKSASESWRSLLTEGVQLPWLTVLQRTTRAGRGVLHSPWLAVALLAIAAAAVTAVWLVGARRSEGYQLDRGAAADPESPDGPEPLATAPRGREGRSTSDTFPAAAGSCTE